MNNEALTKNDLRAILQELGTPFTPLDYYPIGSYYETSDTAFNPNTAWGGTWVSEVNGVFKANCNSYAFKFYNTTNVTQTGTTKKDILTLKYTSNTGKIIINADFPLYTSRYTSNLFIIVDGVEATAGGTNTQTTNFSVDNIPLSCVLTPTIGQEITIKIQINAQDSGTTATVPAYHTGNVTIQDIPVGDGYRWHRTA